MTGTFDYNKNAFGGTEYMATRFHQLVINEVPNLDNYLSLIIPGVTPPDDVLLNSDKEIIVWMHNTASQYSEDRKAILKHPKFLSKVKYFVVVSEYHKTTLIEELNLEESKVYVIPNAFDKLTYNPDKFTNLQQVRIVNTSSPERGMEVLLEALEYIKDDFRLEIYNKYNPDLDKKSSVFSDPRVKFYGWTPKATVREALENAHIHAYPSTYPETSCISQMEAMSAGLLCVTSDLGALPETSGDFGVRYKYIKNIYDHAELFAEKLQDAINQVKNKTFNPNSQVEWVNKTYSWESAKQNWVNFNKLI